MNDAVEVELFRVIIHEKSEEQFIHLRERDGDRSFPIVIGFNEVYEIHRKLRKFHATRPLTHDLLGSVIKALGHELNQIVITELRDRTFFAELVLTDPESGEETRVDCRPSDAVALAVQTGAKIFVA